jgi:hypothetical protein
VAVPTSAQKEMFGYRVGLTVAVLTLIAALFTGRDPGLQVTLCFLGGASGWAVGILASPLDEDEKRHFGDLSKAFVALGSGYVIGKLEGSFVSAIADAIKQDGQLFSFRVALFLTLFTIGLLFTMIGRMYGEDAAKRRERKIAHLLSEAEKITERVQALRREA